MTRLIPTVYLFFVLHHAYGCLPDTKQEYCNIVRSEPYQIERIIPADSPFTMRNMTEFCNFDSVRDGGQNSLCENIQELIPVIPTPLAGNLTEFCSTGSQISRRKTGRQTRVVSIAIESKGIQSQYERCSSPFTRCRFPHCNIL